MSSSTDGAVASLLVKRLTPAEGAEVPADHQQLIDKLATCRKQEKATSELLLEMLNSVSCCLKFCKKNSSFVKMRKQV